MRGHHWPSRGKPWARDSTRLNESRRETGQSWIGLGFGTGQGSWMDPRGPGGESLVLVGLMIPVPRLTQAH